jgi:RecT family
MNQAVTKRELTAVGMDALDRDRVDQVRVSSISGGVSFASALEVMEFAKLMAVSKQAVPKDFRENPGMCLAVAFQAIEWRMSPFQVANKAYVVNDRIAFESQLIHAVIEARAPLKERLNCEYSGEGPSRRCKVIGAFLDGAVREYETPQFKDIKIKNSPLWAADPDQQLWYYGSRAWSRKWCPDVILGLYTRDEIEDDQTEEPQLPGLHTRLIGGNVDRAEGHRPGHVETELSQVGENRPIERPATEPGDADTGEQPEPKNAQEWALWCVAWIKSATDYKAIRARWDSERQLRNKCGVTSDDRVPVQNKMFDRCKELGEPDNG